MRISKLQISSITEETVKGPSQEYPFQIGRNDRSQAAMIGLKRGVIEL